MQSIYSGENFVFPFVQIKWKIKVKILCWPHVEVQWQNSSRDAVNGTIRDEQPAREQCAESPVFIQVTSYFSSFSPYVLSPVCWEWKFHCFGFLN